eukprot:2250309-Pyramimonas_sp.AAC.1
MFGDCAQSSKSHQNEGGATRAPSPNIAPDFECEVDGWPDEPPPWADESGFAPANVQDATAALQASKRQFPTCEGQGPHGGLSDGPCPATSSPSPCAARAWR